MFLDKDFLDQYSFLKYYLSLPDNVFVEKFQHLFDFHHSEVNALAQDPEEQEKIKIAKDYAD